MIPEENPPDAELVDSIEAVEAILVQESKAECEAAEVEIVATLVEPVSPPRPDSDLALENLAATGGAVGAIVLGLWSMIGAFVTPWSAINAMLGLAMGLWGLSSRHDRWAWIGIGCSIAGAILCMYQAS